MGQDGEGRYPLIRGQPLGLTQKTMKDQIGSGLGVPPGVGNDKKRRGQKRETFLSPEFCGV